MTNEVQQASVDVCIATYKRPNLLKKLLASLAQQTIITAIKFRIIIIDNDAEKSAENVVHGFFSDKTLTYIYDVQPQKNIALTRNKALEYANASYIAFIDDDEWAESDWLANLLSTASEYNADVVFGTVIYQLPENAPNWLVKSKFYKPEVVATGKLKHCGASNNTLLRNSTEVKRLLNFDPEYGLTGGEDTDLFTRLFYSGAKMVACKDAIVYETVANDRMTVSWLIKRSLRTGQVYAKIFNKKQPFYKVIISFFQRLGYLFFLGLIFTITLFFGKSHWVYVLSKMATNAGQLSMFFTTKVYQEYK